MAKVKLKFRFRFSMQQSAGKHNTEHCPLAKSTGYLQNAWQQQVSNCHRESKYTSHLMFPSNGVSVPTAKQVIQPQDIAENFTFLSLFGTTPTQSGWSRSSFFHTDIFLSAPISTFVSSLIMILAQSFSTDQFTVDLQNRSRFSPIECTYRTFLGHMPAFET